MPTGTINLSKVRFDKHPIGTNLSDRVNAAIAAGLQKAAVDIVERAEENREFKQFTGNTVASYYAAVWSKNSIVGFANLSNAKVAHAKIPAGKSLWLSNPVEGKARWVRAAKDYPRVTSYGRDLAKSQVMASKPKGTMGISVSTGTEYSEHIEKVRDLDVLSQTFTETAEIIENNLNRLKI